jgi:signal transduction histidine kinase
MLSLNISEFELNNKISEIINNFKLRSESQNINIINNITPDITINYDPQRFTQIVTNILNNSILATDDGGIISFSTSTNNNNLLLKISDNGTGIPKDELPYIFDRFYRTDKSRNRQSGGSGLGLSIVKYLIESHNGTIKINSELSKGTEVLIFIKKFNTNL